MAVQERIYRGSGEVSRAAGLPEASPAAFGAGIGAAIAEGGSELEASSRRAMEAERQRKREASNAQAGVDAAQLSIDLSKSAQTSRDEAPSDGGGHVERIAQESQSAVDAFLQKIPDAKVREHWRVRAAELRGNLIEQEDGWARGQRITSIKTNGKDAGRLWDNQLQTNPDAGVFEQSLKAGDDYWFGVTAPADVKQNGVKEWRADRAQNYSRGLIEHDPAGALFLLKSGALDAFLDANDKAVLVNEAETGVRVAAADMRRQSTQAVQQLHEDVTEYNQTLERGELPGEDVPRKLIARAQALGEVKLVDDIQYNYGKLKLSRETDKWTSADWEQNINALAAKVAGGKASADEQQQLKILQELRPAKETRFRNDPEGYAAATGINVPQVDIANPDPGAVQAKKSWARSFARTGGLLEPPYLNKDQLQVYRDRANQGAVGQLEVASELRRVWGLDAAPSIVRQIGGQAKPDMLIMLGLDTGVGQVYRQGVEALGKKSVKVDDDIARQVYRTYAGAVPADMRPALFDAARNIAAGLMQRNGFTDPPANFEEVFRRSLQFAGGMAGDGSLGGSAGGFVNWNGRFAWLPQDMGRADFQHRMARAAPTDWVRAAVDAQGNPTSAVPSHYGPDGRLRPYTKGEALRFGGGSLETVAPGIYHLKDPAGGTIVDQSGRPWQFDIRRLPRSHVSGR